MTILGKFFFAITVIFVYLITYVLGRTNSVRALQKLITISFGIVITIAIIFPDSFLVYMKLILGVENPTDGILYIFIVFSTALFMLIFRKFEEIENKITRVVQNISLIKQNEDEIN